MLFKNYHVIILNDPSLVDSLTRKAANHNLHCLYKIGVYGCEQQHEYMLSERLKITGFSRKKYRRQSMDSLTS